MEPTALTLYHQLKSFLEGSTDPYRQLNQWRDWVNAHYPDFDFYLEDVWNEKVLGETHFEYILRSKKTYNETEVLGYDVYKNHQDAKGVWHLDDYCYTVRLLEDPQAIVEFISKNS